VLNREYFAKGHKQENKQRGVGYSPTQISLGSMVCKSVQHCNGRKEAAVGK